MATRETAEKKRSLAMMEQVDALGDEVKDLALNLAIYLAKAKVNSGSEELQRMEPDFIRLVNGTVKTIQELTGILQAARNAEAMVYDPPSGRISKDHIEIKLEAIVRQCNTIMDTISESTDLTV